MLYGDVDNAICLHAFYYAIWKRFGALPERYNWQLQAPDVLFYPLRPELVESTYLLYQVTILTCQKPQQLANSFWTELVLCTYRQPKTLSICMLGWIFSRALKKMPKSGVHYLHSSDNVQAQLKCVFQGVLSPVGVGMPLSTMS